MYYFELLAGLYEKKVKYLVIGGLAVSLYGVPRTTQDIDLVISTDRQNVLKLLSVLKDLGYAPRLPVKPEDLAEMRKVKEWTEKRNLKAFSFYNKKEEYKVIDIVLLHPLDFEQSFNNKTVKRVEGVEIYLASLNDLIRTKEASGRAQDLSDVELLKKAKKYSEDE
jgi:hypothetical protein